jgi:hypothetical protein
VSARIAVRKTGSRFYPWEARCSECRKEYLYGSPFGQVAVNTRGIGNRFWALALFAGLKHLEREHHTPDPATPTRAGLPADRQETSDE